MISSRSHWLDRRAGRPPVWCMCAGQPGVLDPSGRYRCDLEGGRDRDDCSHHCCICKGCHLVRIETKEFNLCTFKCKSLTDVLQIYSHIFVPRPFFKCDTRASGSTALLTKKKHVLCSISKFETPFWKINKCIIYYSKLSKEFKRGIEILVGQVVFKLWIKTVKMLFASITQELVGLPKFDAICEFLGQFTIRCIYHFSKRCW